MSAATSCYDLIVNLPNVPTQQEVDDSSLFVCLSVDNYRHSLLERQLNERQSAGQGE